MSIRRFTTFIAVSRYGSFAAAAHRIGLTQAAVSIQMSALEEELRVQLLIAVHVRPFLTRRP